MSRPLFVLLADDWQDLLRSPAAHRLLRWCRTELEIPGDDLDQVVDQIWTAGRAEADQHLARIVSRARDDASAARLLLHVLRPGLRSLAGRLTRTHPQADADDELLAIAWEKIRCYPIERRPRSIAANILLDTRKQYLRWIDKGLPWINLEDLADTSALLIATASAEEELLNAEPVSLQLVHSQLVSAMTDGTITPTAAEIIWRTRIEGEPECDVAADYGVKLRTLQRRRQRAERRLEAAS